MAPSRPALGRRVLLLADMVHPFVYRESFPSGVPDVDLVLAAGDLPGSYLEFVASKLTVPVVYVHGNHANEKVTDEEDRRVPPRGVIAAHRRVVEEAGIRIAGWGGAPRYRQGGPGQYSRAEARWGLGLLALKARRGVDVLLTHAPPLGPHAGQDFAHRGDPDITRFLERRTPSVLVHGHIHEYEGKKLEYVDERGTRVLNAYGYRIVDL
ncbi:metallophosphoesterase [Deinococcus sp.]|uniref:metallophosphoesterase family protein n=1 Tax=Deinococcus sp. TaxID=47478 RepID=UPI002869A435|nr:metallophosphoesterase [Deinococcus sp.]